MKIQCFSIVTGGSACNARCPYCVSKMTGVKEIGVGAGNVNWRNFDKSCRFAKINGVSNVIITGKGEPTLFPDLVTEYLENLKKYEFPIIELQTNGIVLVDKKYENYLKKWYELGLTIISLSIVHYKREKNKEIYTPDRSHYDIYSLVNKLHDFGYSVRLSCLMMKNFIDCKEEAEKMIEKAKEWRVEQLSLRELAAPISSENKEVHEWTLKNILEKGEYNKIREYVIKNGNKLTNLAHGAAVYDVEGQNVCMTNALTINPNDEDLRQIIFFPDGHLRFDWQFRGATII